MFNIKKELSLDPKQNIVFCCKFVGWLNVYIF